MAKLADGVATYDTIWYTRCPVPTATGIAADLGWLTAEFASDGIEVRSPQDIPRAEAAHFHYTHAHPGLFREGGNVPALRARPRGEAPRLIGLTWIEERQVIHVREGSTVVEPGQLKGLRLAIPVADRHRAGRGDGQAVPDQQRHAPPHHRAPAPARRTPGPRRPLPVRTGSRVQLGSRTSARSRPLAL
ncbi:MAG TPA: hypothetical protein VHZ03_21560 [Trebonia sp.]|nr:hypothetical protein [Trebonia sp.]